MHSFRREKKPGWRRAAWLALATGVLLSACKGASDSHAASSPDLRSPSVARLWNEVLLDGIRHDFARPPVHARNLFHVSAAMYDAWSAYSNGDSTPYLFGSTQGGDHCHRIAFPVDGDVLAKREEAISYAAYRMIIARFANSPGRMGTRNAANALMLDLGYDTSIETSDYHTGSAAALGNYIANCYLAYGARDGSNEQGNYANIEYQPFNPPIEPNLPGNPDIIDLDRWQQISLPLAIDQSGHQVNSVPPFAGAEWGQVAPFALSAADLGIRNRDGHDYWVYQDPGQPPSHAGSSSAAYKWSFSLVAIWSSHLDPTDGEVLDISPRSIGNVQSYPATVEEYDEFYDRLAGGDPGTGHALNPATGQPYEPQIVPRGDYARVLAEFWADGPDSETPPGHWFVIFNSVSDNPLLVKRYEGAGPILGPLEWDVKGYFTLGGAMHDAAIAAWGVKGWYDYVRPVSAIRAMADRGQSSDPLQPSYDPDGIPLEPGLIELIAAGDPLAGAANENVGKIKLYAWRGPTLITDPAVDEAGVGWILAENWWPYQRPTLVTPPFAGYVSGHSTFSRAAAEVLTALTGDPYFPGGMSSFEVKANDFLVFEEGPTVDMTLEWATYRDAADQCSLSRIWGGIHPPIDDMPGRLMGARVGPEAFEFARSYILGR